MATTTNFGWETPDDTDLVKDGAAAMRTLGNSIDTSFVDLKGGTTGQILAKASNTDLDYTWTTVSGDIEGVTAGTGISGGGTSGTVTITNSMATAIDAKGDLIAGTGADTFSRLAVGTNGQSLIADSTAATGLKWGTAGKLIQVVSATYQTQASGTTTTLFDTGLTASITPTATTSKILVLINQMLYLENPSSVKDLSYKFALLRGSTKIISDDAFTSAWTEANGGISYSNTGGGQVSRYYYHSYTWLDSPNTTSATTYKTQVAAQGTAAYISAQQSARNPASSIILIEIGA